VAGRSFFDTNVLVYAHAGDEPQKRKVARKMLVAHLEDQTAVEGRCGSSETVSNRPAAF
jgi:predicted nucleic acid-binding protein